MSKSVKHRRVRSVRHMVAMLLILAVGGPSVGTALAEETTSVPMHLTIQGLKDGQLISKHDLGIIQFEVGLGQKRLANQPPVKFDDEKLGIYINHRPLNFLRSGSGTGHEGDISYRTHRLAIRPGMPGSKRLTARYGGLKAECSFNYQPKGQLEFLDLIERQAILRGDVTHIRWLGAYLVADSIALTVNGRAHSAGTASGPAPELHSGTVDGVLTRGANNIALAASDIFGSAIRITRTVFYYPRNTVPKDAVFGIPMGPMGSKSGPFFRARPRGSSLRSFKPGREYPHLSQPVLLQLEKRGLRAKRVRFVLAWFKAVAPGRALVPIQTKRYFRDENWQVARIIELQIGL